MAKTTRAPSRLRQRRIVERPRLRRLLDDATPRVRMLIAPAGFGKTTLAEQWADGPGRRSAWYRARSSSRDVAVLATGLSDAAATVLPGCDARFRERLSVTGNPSEEAHILAEMLAEDLSGWPDDAWLVLDDHHNFDGASASELFLATLVRQAPVNVLLTSRDRPAWVSSRDLLYGSVFELSQSALAMTQEEASDVLVDWDRSRASGLIALADGWPAVIGLAGIAPDAAEPDAAPPAELYAYFAEEVLQALGDDVRDGLSVLAIPPVLDAQIASALLGPERARRVCAEGLAAGILVDRGGRLDVHPLAVQYVRATGTFGADGAAIDAAVALYATRQDWEAAGELVQRTRASDSMGPLLQDALPELLASAHLGTIEAWIGRMSEALPIVRIARAELDLREGRLAPAETLALGVSGDATNDPLLRRQAAIVAGRAAHLASREAEGAMHFELAESLASDESERREAAWGRIMCAAALETPDARTLLDELRASSANSDPLEIVRMADKDLAVSFHAGRIEGLVDARRAAELLDHVSDPMARCSFRSMFAGALNLTCDYAEGVAVAEEMAEDASAFRIDFAIPHAFSAMAAGLIGQRDYPSAHIALDRSGFEARRRNDGFGILNVYSNRMRCLAQEQRADEACAVELPDTSSSVRGIAAEGRCSRALALACNNRLDEASALVEDIRNITLSVEPLALAHVVEAVIAVRRRSSDLASRLESAVDQAFETGAIDMLVCGYRSSPDLFGALLTHPATRERTLFAVARASDEHLVPEKDTAPTYTTPLTRRELEVHGLICEGLSNAEIANVLFLSEGTVKVHVHHIFDKLGIRNRAALIMLAAAERNRQATPASGRSSTDDSSSALD